MSENPEPVFGIATLEQISDMTGKEHLQAIIDGVLPAPPIARTLSFRMVEVGDGEVLFEATPGPDLLNPMGGVHGGWALTLIDTVTGCAAHSTLPAGVGYASIETKANFSRPIKADTGLVRAEGRVVSKGRTIISAEGKIIDREGRVLAHGTSTVMLLPR
jgi:uncharacterized protein (TIGR00369 family)